MKTVHRLGPHPERRHIVAGVTFEPKTLKIGNKEQTVGVAVVDDETAKQFEGNKRFRIVEDEKREGK